MRSTLFFIFIFSTILCFGQEQKKKNKYQGFLGSKFIINAQSSFYFPVINYLLTDLPEGIHPKYKLSSNGTVKPYKDFIDYELKLGASYFFDRNFGLGLDVSQKYFAITPINYGLYYLDDNSYLYSDYYLSDVRFSDIPVVTTSIMPRFEFSSSRALLPIGLSHSFGFGFNKSKFNLNELRIVRDNSYTTFENDIYKDTLVEHLNTLLANSNTEIEMKSVSLQYGINLRTPLSKHIILTYNFSYSLNINTTNYAYNWFGSDDISFDKNELFKESYGVFITRLRKESFRNILKFGIGLAVVF